MAFLELWMLKSVCCDNSCPTNGMQCYSTICPGVTCKPSVSATYMYVQHKIVCIYIYSHVYEWPQLSIQYIVLDHMVLFVDERKEVPKILHQLDISMLSLYETYYPANSRSLRARFVRVDIFVLRTCFALYFRAKYSVKFHGPCLLSFYRNT